MESTCPICGEAMDPTGERCIACGYGPRPRPRRPRKSRAALAKARRKDNDRPPDRIAAAIRGVLDHEVGGYLSLLGHCLVGLIVGLLLVMAGGSDPWVYHHSTTDSRGRRVDVYYDTASDSLQESRIRVNLVCMGTLGTLIGLGVALRRAKGE